MEICPWHCPRDNGSGDGKLKKLSLPSFKRCNLKSGGNFGTSYGASLIYCGGLEEPQVVTLRQWMCDLMQQREDITDAMDAKNITLTAKEHQYFDAGRELE